MVRIIFSEVVLLAVVLNASVLKTQSGSGRESNSYIVQVTKGADPSQVGRGVVQRTRGKLGHVYKNAVRGFSVQLPPGLAKQAIEAQSGVLLVEPDVPVYAVAQILPTGIDRIEADNSCSTTPVDVDIAIIDTPPSVTITNPAEGATVSGSVTVTADASDDAGVNQVEFFVDGGSIGVDADGADGWSAYWDTTQYSNGVHTVRATATDTTAQTTSDTVETTVNNAQAPRIAQVDVLAMPLLSYRKWWVATAMVTVAENGIPVPGATVEGLWSGLYNKAASNTTDDFGFISFETNWLRKAGTVTFTVTKVIAPDGQEYVLDPPEPSGSTTGP